MKIGFSFMFLLFIAATESPVQAQTLLINELKLPQIAPPSPDAAAIEKFGNFSVNYSTGVPGINIPLWTVQCGTLSWPIGLSYHASGIKVDESASMAGLGWTLDGIGVITRLVNGRPDEETSLGEPTDFTSVTVNDWDYLYKVSEGRADGELDIFNFSFNGRSGKFVIKHDATGGVLQVPQSNLKITHDAALHVFTIKDEIGAVYTFDLEERSTNNSGSPTYTTYTTSWYLTKVELPDKNNSIQFTYTYAGPTTDFYFSYTQAMGRKYVETLPGYQPTLQNLSPSMQSSTSSVNINLVAITSITFPNGSITFNYDVNAREDIGSNNVYNKLTSIVINEANGLMTPVKAYRFNQTYFSYTPIGYSSNPTNKRLRLDNLVEATSATGTELKRHTFQYNLTANLSPRGSTGQDIWGFNNGKTDNASLLQSESVSYYDGSTTINGGIGNADRSVNAAQMEAWMLTSITYPTGGKTVFDYEPHVYSTEATLVTGAGTSISVMGNQTPPLDKTSSTVTFPGSGGVVPGTSRVTVNLSECNFAGVTQLSAVYLTDVTSGQDIYVLSHPRPGEKYSIDFPISLIGGHQYKVRATLSTNPSVISPADAAKLSASISVTWSESTTTPDIRTGGGLRIKEMIHYTDNTTIATKETFVYDTAITMTPFNLINQRYKEVNYQLGIESGFGCATWMGPVCRVYYSQSVFAVSNVLGSPMLYRRVEKINVNPTTGAPNGKSVYLYDVFRDYNIPFGGALALGAQWSNGFLTSETHYKYNGSWYEMIQKKENEYNVYNNGATYSLRVEPRYIVDRCFITHSSSTVTNDLRYGTVHLPTGSKRLVKQTVTELDEFQHNLVTTTVNYYGSSDYDYPTKVAVSNSRNGWDSVTYKRPPDFAVTNNVYDKMEMQNILQPVIEQVSYSNGTKLSTLKNNYRDWFNNSRVFALDTVQASLYNNPLETRIRYLGYDAFGNPLSMSRDKDITTSYLWAYNNARPIAQVTNASNSNIAYTSFETAETGGWSGITAVGTALSGSLTGIRAFTKTNFNISKSGLSNSTSYIVSFWSKNGAYSVNAVAATAGRTVNGWTFYSRKVTPTTGSISVTGTGTIDELRLYPASSQMTSYTYEPLGGVTSASDPNHRITFYEYDELQRPILIRDQDRNIVKKFAYNYSGVTEYPSISYNTAKSVVKYRSNCTGCQIGSLVTYTVPAGVYVSTVGDADALALAEANANAQAYADSLGVCTTPSSATVPADNNVTNAGFSVRFHNTCTNSNYTFSLGPNFNTASLSPAIPNGNYDVTFTKMTGPGTYIYWIQGQSRSTSTDPVFNNIEIKLTGNQGVMINP